MGEVCVNGLTTTAPDVWVTLPADRITFRGKQVPRRQRVYLMLNKPAGYVTTRADERGRKTVYDLLPGGFPWVFPVGRLDKDSSGLLLMTNDTGFGEMITNPASHIPKTYRLRVGKPITADIRRRMESRFVLPDGTILRPAQVRLNDNDPTVCDITIDEGKNRQIRRMCESLGYAVLELRRIAIGRLKLGRMPEGSIRPLSDQEVTALTRQP